MSFQIAPDSMVGHDNCLGRQKFAESFSNKWPQSSALSVPKIELSQEEWWNKNSRLFRKCKRKTVSHALTPLPPRKPAGKRSGTRRKSLPFSLYYYKLSALHTQSASYKSPLNSYRNFEKSQKSPSCKEDKCGLSQLFQMTNSGEKDKKEQFLINLIKTF